MLFDAACRLDIRDEPQDSDCNPSNAGGVLFTTMGFEKIPDRFKSALHPKGKFSHKPYNSSTLVEVSKKLVQQGSFANAKALTTTFTMPVNNVIITVSYAINPK